MKRFVILIVACVALVGGGCSGGLASKTAKDITTAAEMILPEYQAYFEADPKLKEDQKTDRRNQIQALRNVLKAAQN